MVSGLLWGIVKQIIWYRGTSPVGGRVRRINKSAHTIIIHSFTQNRPALRRNLVQEGSTLTENELGAIFTVGSWSTQGGRFLTGIARDRLLGTRRTTALCVTAAAAGMVGIAFAGEHDSVALGISLFFVGIGSGAQLCLQPVAGLFDDRFHGTILASLSGAFQVSGLVFLILLNITRDRRKALGPFALCLFGLAIIAGKLLPKKNFSKKPKEVPRDFEDMVDEEDGKPKQVFLPNATCSQDGHKLDSSEINEDAQSNGGSGICINEGSSSPNTDACDLIESESEEIKEKGLMDLIRTWEYFLLVIWFSVQLVPLQYYVAAIGFQLERMGDNSGYYTSMFSIIYASSAVFAPIIGKIADAAGLGCGQGIATVLTSTSFFILSFEIAIPLDGHIPGMVCYGVGRMIVFGMFFTNIGKRFGYTHYGTLAGLGLIVSALFSLLQYPLIAIAAAGHETVVNITCGAVMLVQGLPYCFWLLRRERNQYQPSPRLQ